MRRFEFFSLFLRTAIIFVYALLNSIFSSSCWHIMRMIFLNMYRGKRFREFKWSGIPFLCSWLVDFVIQRKNKVLPLEVKAEENLQAKSLRALCKKYELPDAVRSSMSGYREEEWMVNVPLYILRTYLENV